ncbi:hypothetical protein V493_02049 [Pseudogymnoascus sp. VKM F-4281 (FW-2241)]|nr:hypothetical protein V493_02049 [Pseudogymnoascus sp. VKM F-4281 (FW-2241)]
MRFAIILVAASATIVAAQGFEQCSDTQALLECASPINSAIGDCGVENVDCFCKNITDSLDCFEKYCPQVEFPFQSIMESRCGAGSYSSDNDEPEANDDTSGASDDQKSGGGEEGAGASLFAPSSGLLSAIVAVAAML